MEAPCFLGVVDGPCAKELTVRSMSSSLLPKSFIFDMMEEAAKANRRSYAVVKVKVRERGEAARETKDRCKHARTICSCKSPFSVNGILI